MASLLDYLNRLVQRSTLLLPSHPWNVQRPKQCIVLYTRHHRACLAVKEFGRSAKEHPAMVEELL